MAEEIIIKTVLDLSGSEQVIKRQVEKALVGRESAEDRHNRRIEALHLQSATRIQQIEARKQAQIDTIRERGIQKELEHQRKIERETQRAANAFSSMRTAIAGVSGAFGVLAGLGVVSLFENIARRSLDAAVAIDRQVNTLKALTGSAQAAEQRFAALFALAQKTPGLTTNLALTLDAQLRILNVTEKTIDRLLPTIGRLNAIAPLGDPRRFAENLGQLITQGFEKQDLRELVGNSPFAGELIKAVFDVDSPTNAKAIREAAGRLGIKTFEDFAIAFVKAAESDTRLQAVTESIGTRFEKLQDRLNVALAPLGQEIGKTLLPLFEDLVAAAEKYGAIGAEIFKDNRSDIIATVRSVGDLIGRLGDLTGAIFDLGSRAKVGLSGLKQEFEDIASIFAFLTDVSEGNIVSRPRTNALAREQEAGRSSPFLESPVRTLPEIPQARRRTGGGAGGSGGSGVGGRRSRTLAGGFVNDFGLADAGRLEHEAELARIRRSNEAVAARRQAEAAGDLLFFARSREVDLGGQQRAIDDQMGEQARLFLENQEKVNKELKETIKLAQEMDPSFRFMRGLAGETDATASAFERLGQSIGDAFGDLSNLLSSLGRAVKQFFGDLLSATLRTAASSILGPLFGGAGGGAIGGLFRTPSFAGGFGGGGISAPPSVSAGGILSSIFGGGGGGGVSGAVSGGGGLGDFIGAGVPRTAGSVLSGGRFNFSGLGQSLANAAPLLGLTLGAGLGGRSVGGNILGAAGGLLTSTFLSTTLGAPGALGSLAPALFSNPITAIAGAGLLVGAVLLGKSKQRKQDEEASGQFLTQALQGIEELAAGVTSGQIDGTQARSLFENQILGTFRQQISQLKTKSVVESRLKNQVNDLRKVFEARIPPLVAEQQAKQLRLSENADRFSRQVPEFATGGTTRGGLALLHPGEKVLNLQQQASVIGQSNPRVFENAGVPGPNRNRIFDVGGTMGPGQGIAQPIEITFGQSVIVISDKTAEGIYVTGAKSSRGQQVSIKNFQQARIDGDL
jgi:hypothetical protein